MKANNQRLKANVFGPVEDARRARLSAKLLEIASQPKPVPERTMEDAEEKSETEQKEAVGAKPTDSKFLLAKSRPSPAFATEKDIVLRLPVHGRSPIRLN